MRAGSLSMVALLTLAITAGGCSGRTPTGPSGTGDGNTGGGTSGGGNTGGGNTGGGGGTSSRTQTSGCSGFSAASGGGPMCGVLPTMGNFAADQAMNGEVGLQRSFWSGILVNGVFALNDCAPENANALADPQTRQIYFGAYLFNKLVVQHGNILPVAGVLAHEWGHQVQFQFGWQTNPVRAMELEADAFAGYFMALAKGWAWVYMQSYFQSVFESGDYNFNHPGHHGTKEQRYAAARLGFDTAMQAATTGRPYSYTDLHLIFRRSIASVNGWPVPSVGATTAAAVADVIAMGEAQSILLGAKGSDGRIDLDEASRRRLWPR